MRKETLLKIIGLFRKNIGKGMTMLEIAKTLKIGYIACLQPPACHAKRGHNNYQ